MTSTPYMVISTEDDGHIPFVEKHMDRSFTVINPASVVNGVTFSYSVVKGHVDVRYDEKRIANVRSVWNRRLFRHSNEKLPVAPHLQEYCGLALHNFSTLLWTRFPSAFWLPEPQAHRRARDKVLQLELAARLGFKVPETLFTSSVKDAKGFVSSHHPVVAKSIDSGGFERDGHIYGFYTSKVTAKTDFSGINLAPSILQEAIDVGIDLRVTVVGDQVFTASATGENNRHRHVRDWRFNQHAVKYFELPRKISDLCVAYVRELGLSFGAIDLIKDKKGAFWFLEINPNGQWAFVEHDTGQPIGKAIADLLMSGKARLQS